MASLKPDLAQEDIVPASEDAAAKFITPENPKFPYALVYTSLHRMVQKHFVLFGSFQAQAMTYPLYSTVTNFTPFDTFEALHNFRCAESSQDLWTDQTCINQTHIAELDKVLLTRDIYGNPARTQIRLGEAAADPPSSPAFDLLEDVLRTKRADTRAYIMKIDVTQPGYRSTGDSLRKYLSAEEKWWALYHPAQIQQRRARQAGGRQDDAFKAVTQ